MQVLVTVIYSCRARNPKVHDCCRSPLTEDKPGNHNAYCTHMQFQLLNEESHTWFNKWFWISWYALYMYGSCRQNLHLRWPKEMQTKTLLHQRTVCATFDQSLKFYFQYFSFLQVIISQVCNIYSQVITTLKLQLILFIISKSLRLSKFILSKHLIYLGHANNTFPYHLGEDCCPLSLENAYKFLGSLSFGTQNINNL